MNDDRYFESYLQLVFSSLLNMRNEGVVVGRNVQLVDKFGLAHEVDIFYQFERTGITHKVVIECKDNGRAVQNGEVAKFYGKLCDAGALRLVMVARSGYQKLAREYTEKHGILLLTSDQLDHRRWAARGLSRQALRTFLLMCDILRERSSIHLAVMFTPPGLGPGESFLCVPTECRSLMMEYYGDHLELMKAWLPHSC